MVSWAEGYVADVAYTLGYYREMAPDHMAFAAISIGKNPGGALRPQRVLDLGFGMGLGFIIGAASNPKTIYEGCDFNPEHILNARSLASSSGLTNVVIHEASFQELAAKATDGQQDCDIIALHGILSWVSEDAHRAILEIIRKRLKPGGYVYVSYNCMPGWAPMIPIRRYMLDQARAAAGGSMAKTAAAVQGLRAMLAGKGRYFTANPALEGRIEKLASMAMSYLPHEYLNEHWHIFHVADVARMFSDAKLSFVGSATIAENIDGVCVPAEMQPMVAAATDPIWKETLRDIAANKQFRRDLYARGLAALNNHEAIRLLQTTKYTLAVPRPAVTMKIPGPLGELDCRPDLYGPLADLLADSIVPFDAIITMPAFASVGIAGALQALALFVNAGHVLPIMTEPEVEVAPAQRLNRHLASLANVGRVNNFLAAPVARAGIPVSSIEMLAFSALVGGTQAEVSQLTYQVGEQMSRLTIIPNDKDGKPIQDKAEIQAKLTTDITIFVEQKLPLWRRLGVL